MVWFMKNLTRNQKIGVGAIVVVVALYGLYKLIKSRQKNQVGNPTPSQSQIYADHDFDDSNIKLQWPPLQEPQGLQEPITFQQYCQIVDNFKCPINQQVMRSPYKVMCCNKVFEEEYWKAYTSKHGTCYNCNRNDISLGRKDDPSLIQINKLRIDLKKIALETQDGLRNGQYIKINRDFGYGYVSRYL